MSQSPIIATPLLEDVLDELHTLLRSLRPDEWHLPTVSSKRLVRDIVAHLLDGSVRRLSMQRDRYTSPPPNGPNRGETLLDYLNRLNNSWEQATRRLSPNVMIDLLEVADRQYVEFIKTLDPLGQAFFPVAWAGEESSLNWFDVGREYTEKWHHTQQIFLATGTREYDHWKKTVSPVPGSVPASITLHVQRQNGLGGNERCYRSDWRSRWAMADCSDERPLGSL